MPAADDDAWLDQLREALASTSADAPADPEDPLTAEPPQLSAHPAPTAQPAEPLPDLGAPDDAHLREALNLIGTRLAALETSVRQLVEQRPATDDLEALLTRIVRDELAPIVEDRSASRSIVGMPSAGESLDHWAERVDLADAPTGDVVVLVNDLHRRIAELESLHRRALDELTSDRRKLIDEAVGEIRRLLFGD